MESRSRRSHIGVSHTVEGSIKLLLFMCDSTFTVLSFLSDVRQLPKDHHACNS